MRNKWPVQITLTKYQGIMFSSKMDATAEVLFENLPVRGRTHQFQPERG